MASLAYRWPAYDMLSRANSADNQFRPPCIRSRDSADNIGGQLTTSSACFSCPLGHGHTEHTPAQFIIAEHSEGIVRLDRGDASRTQVLNAVMRRWSIGSPSLRMPAPCAENEGQHEPAKADHGFLVFPVGRTGFTRLFQALIAALGVFHSGPAALRCTIHRKSIFTAQWISDSVTDGYR